MNSSSPARGSSPGVPAHPYVVAVARCPLLSPEEERELGRRWRDHRDRDAHARLVGGQLRWVLAIARDRARPCGLAHDDLVQEGNLGLLRALDTWDPAAGTLATYARHWIRVYVDRAIDRSRGAVRRPPGRRSADASLDAMDPDGEVLAEVLSDGSAGPEAEVAAGQERDVLGQVLGCEIASLTPRERHVVTRRHLDDEKRTLRELAGELGCTPERVRQIEARALRKLRKGLERPLAANDAQGAAVADGRPAARLG
ncbi:sigma-70 family RNA polymerase sigma factor [Myxococcota bacterium]|nr:sigma-70 family RNA polymerase sigma factor [Myxococcota bacterium]